MFTISASKLRSYISCPKKYDFVYNEEIEPIEKAEALEMGGSYHEKIANFIKTQTLEEGYTKTDVMAKVFAEMIYPELLKEYGGIEDVEVYKEMQLTDDIKMIGYLDGITKTSKTPVEHKTTSRSVDEFYMNRLNWDNQVAMYMILTGRTKCIYTVIQKPTIRQKQNETEEEYLQRCYEWYKTDTEKKIGWFEVIRTPGELEAKKQEIIEIVKDIQNKKVFYRNPYDCSIMGCPYSSICLDYDKNVMPIGFKKKENDRKVGNQDD